MLEKAYGLLHFIYRNVFVRKKRSSQFVKTNLPDMNAVALGA